LIVVLVLLVLEGVILGALGWELRRERRDVELGRARLARTLGRGEE